MMSSASFSLIPETYFSRSSEAVFRSTPTRFTHDSTAPARLCLQLFLIDVVLILADADRLRFDLHQLRQRILQPPGDRDRAANRHVQFGKFLARSLRCRIHRRAGFVHDDDENVQAVLLDHSADKGFRFPRTRAVADRDASNVVFLHQLEQSLLGALEILAAVRSD